MKREVTLLLVFTLFLIPLSTINAADELKVLNLLIPVLIKN